MSLVCCNGRDLEKLSVVSKLKFLVRYYKSDVLFLSETLVHINKIEEFHYLLGFDYCFAPEIISRERHHFILA